MGAKILQSDDEQLKQEVLSAENRINNGIGGKKHKRENTY